MGSVPSAPAARAELLVPAAGAPPGVRGWPGVPAYGPAARLVVGRVLRDLRPLAAGALGVDADLVVTDPWGVRVGPLGADPSVDQLPGGSATARATATVTAAAAAGPVAGAASPAAAPGTAAATVTAAMRAREQDWGTLEVTRRDGRAWEDRHLPMVGLVADVAASCVAMAGDAGRPAPGPTPAGRRMIGVAVSQPGRGVADLVAAADAAVEEARRDRPGSVAPGRSSGGPLPGSRGELEEELSRAPAAGQLRVHYQPIVTAGPPGTVGARGNVGPLAGHWLVAVEALLRWQHPTRGLLAAGDFASVAERTGAIGPIGQWVVEQTCAQLAVWRTQLPASVWPHAFVNLCPSELADPALAGALARSTAAHGVRPGQLGLEIVEGDFADRAILTSLAEHEARGHPLAIDDFGTGYSSLSRLVDLPVAFVKMDRSLVTGLARDVRRRRLVDAVVVVAHTLGAAVIAEGVESDDQVGLLRRAGCDLLQGNLLGRPVPGDELSGRWVEAADAELVGADAEPVGGGAARPGPGAVVGTDGAARAAFDCLVTGAA